MRVLCRRWFCPSTRCGFVLFSSSQSEGNGRACPLSYYYGAAALEPRCADVEADVVFVVGGLYGNVEALREIESRVAGEYDSMKSPLIDSSCLGRRGDESEPIGALRAMTKKTAVVFNGDFNFFNANVHEWDIINRSIIHGTRRFNDMTRCDQEVREGVCTEAATAATTTTTTTTMTNAIECFATAGNVEVEASDFPYLGFIPDTESQGGGGCGCAYPMYVSDSVVERSNRIVGLLRRVAAQAEGISAAAGKSSLSGESFRAFAPESPSSSRPRPRPPPPRPLFPRPSPSSLTPSEYNLTTCGAPSTKLMGGAEDSSIASWLRTLPKFLTIQVGGREADAANVSRSRRQTMRQGGSSPRGKASAAPLLPRPRLGIIHGDPNSLAGWAFSCEAMEVT